MTGKVSAQSFYDINTIQKIELQFSQSDWDYRMDTAKAGSEGYLMAQVRVNGVQFDSIGVKYKGNISYDSTVKKNPLHIALDEFTSLSYQGYTDIKLSNCYADPSMIREVLSYSILKNYMDCPLANFAQVYINGQYYGLYSNIESINKKFCSSRFSSSSGTFIKCNPTITSGPTSKSNLKYISADSTSYFKYYEMKSKTGWNELVALCDSLTNHPESVSSVIDLDRVLWMLAFNSALVNLDSYSGVFAQNYYLYKDKTNRFLPIVWDLNMSFGGFPFVGSGNSSMGSLSILNLQQLPADIHATDPYWVLINAIMKNATYRRMYFAHLRTIMSEIFADGSYKIDATKLQTLINVATNSDSLKFFSNEQFTNSMTVNYPFGSYSIPGVASLMDARVKYLASTSEYSAVAPTIVSVHPNSTSPSPKSEISIRATLSSNASKVLLKYRLSADDTFTTIEMLDDGNHNDGAAGDMVFGASFSMQANSVQYYVYAENFQAGNFSPARAEHEFYTLRAVTTTLSRGDVVINEFLASNKSGATNEKGKYEDWIELYNTTNTAIELAGAHLTDNFLTPEKFVFPQNSRIEPHAYLVLWADQDSTTAQYLHCNFKLSADGEQLMLSDAALNMVDSITFGAQTADVSTGRCPNGTGAFTLLQKPSFNTENICVTGVNEYVDINTISIRPNPANDILEISIPTANEHVVTITNTIGTIVFQQNIVGNSIINTSNLASGVYSLRIGITTERFIIIH
jgi:hypothetical protein